MVSSGWLPIAGDTQRATARGLVSSIRGVFVLVVRWDTMGHQASRIRLMASMIALRSLILGVDTYR